MEWAGRGGDVASRMAVDSVRDTIRGDHSKGCPIRNAAGRVPDSGYGHGEPGHSR